MRTIERYLKFKKQWERKEIGRHASRRTHKKRGTENASKPKNNLQQVQSTKAENTKHNKHVESGGMQPHTELCNQLWIHDMTCRFADEPNKEASLFRLFYKKF